MSEKLEGKVAVVTGGNSGIGLAAARRFVAEGPAPSAPVAASQVPVSQDEVERIPF